METTWSPHERIANRRHGNFLLTGLGAIRNRACVRIPPSAEIPVDWSLLGEDAGNSLRSHNARSRTPLVGRAHVGIDQGGPRKLE
jgi:hypothetical protein